VSHSHIHSRAVVVVVGRKEGRNEGRDVLEDSLLAEEDEERRRRGSTSAGSGEEGEKSALWTRPGKARPGG
jgi:hypothetical protein